MANLVDIFTQTNSTNAETPLLFTKEGEIKDKSSLFDSLLQTTMDTLQKTAETNIEKSFLKQNQNVNNSKTNSKVQTVSESIMETIISQQESLQQTVKLETITVDKIKEKFGQSNVDKLETNKANLSNQETEIKGIETNESINQEESLNDLMKEFEKNKNQEQIIKTSTTTIKQNEDVTIIQKEILSKDLNQNSVKIEQNVEVINKNIQDIQIDNNKTDTQALSNESLLKEQEIDLDIDLNQEKKLSLMDRLILENSKKTTLLEKDSLNQNLGQNTKNASTLNIESQKIENTNILLADQKNSLTSQLLFNKNEAVKILEQGTNLEDIEKSAKILDLQVDTLEVESEVLKEDLKNIKIDTKEQLERKQILNALLGEKDVRSIDVKNLITSSVEASKALADSTINIVEDQVVEVSHNLTHSIQSRIIGAKQHLTSMMSDIARQMYENYKPPVTAFRINLNPVNMGSIAILMKQDGVSGLNISMSASSLATLEMLIENQNMLRNSLVKTFSDDSNFNLDFSQGQDSNNQSSNNQNKNRDSQDTNFVLKLKEENQDFEVSNEYM